MRPYTDLHSSFDEATVNNRKYFTFTLPLVGEIRCEFYHFGKLSFHFGLQGAVSPTGYKSNFLHRDQLAGYENPQQVAEILANQLYQAEGKHYQKQLRVKVLENTQLRIF